MPCWRFDQGTVAAWQQRWQCTVGRLLYHLLSMGSYLVTPSVFKLQKWFLHKNGVEFNQKSKSDLTKEALGGEQRCSQT